MKKYSPKRILIGFVILTLILTGCATKNISPVIYHSSSPKYQLDPKPSLTLLLNTVDVAAKGYRNNKAELFKNLIDSVLITCQTELEKRELIKAVIVQKYMQDSTFVPDTVSALMDKYHASHAIVINSFNIDFTQTDVLVEKSSSGSKSREAFYDIVSDIDLSFYIGDSLFNTLQMTKSAHHSSRKVVSGLLSAGPNVVAQRKAAWLITRANLEEYLNLFFKSKALQ